MTQIAHIGAGNAGFGKRFLIAVMTAPARQDTTHTHLDSNTGAIELMAMLVRRLTAPCNSPIQIE